EELVKKVTIFRTSQELTFIGHNLEDAGGQANAGLVCLAADAKYPKGFRAVDIPLITKATSDFVGLRTQLGAHSTTLMTMILVLRRQYAMSESLRKSLFVYMLKWKK
ncbi:hypothetical protein ACJX0J_034697, partial [Zea mays]